jgi:hypothetical protein
MNVRALLTLGAVVLLAACDATTAIPPIGDGLVFRPRTAAACTDGGYECTSAEALGPVTASLSTLGFSCDLETCGFSGGTPVSVTVDAQGTFYDLLTSQCNAGGYGYRWSYETCWDCTADCGPVPNCPSGKNCMSVTLPGQEGSDCRAFACAEGWEFYVNGSFVAPQCRRQAPSGPPGTPSTSASIVNGNVVLSWSPVSGADSYRVFRQLDWQSSEDVWYYELPSAGYNDGSTQVTAIIGGQSGYWVSYRVEAVNSQGISSGGTKHYFTYVPPAPY